MKAPIWASALLASGVGTTIGAFLTHSVFWMTIGEVEILTANLVYQYALGRLLRDETRFLNELKDSLEGKK